MSTTIFDPTLNLSNLDGSNGFVINGVGLADATANSVSSAGDINGDGIDDLIIGAYYSDGANDNSSVNQFFPEGKSYVVFGKNQIFNASLPLADLDGSNGFIINGVDWSDYSGVSVSGIGDFNGDGIDDLIIGAYKANGENNNFSDAGESYVVFGSTQGFSANLNLSSLDGSNGFVIYGIDEDDQSGISVSGIGDINQDGLSDLIIGTSGGDGVDNDVTDAGESYVVYGSQSPGSKLALSSLDGSNGFVIHGIDSNDFSGRSVAGAGDVNGDGVNDLIIGAPSADGIDNNTYKSGESYVIFGGILGSIVDLSSLDGNNGFTIYGIDEYDRSGSSVSGAGDVNGDGLSDLIIGAPRASDLDNGSINIGESYVVFGSDQPFSSELALSSLNGSNGFVIYGSNPSDYFGDSVAGAGDVNGDGLDDLIIGAPDANGENDNGFREGESAVIFGSRQNFPASLNLSSLNGNNGFIIYGASDQDESGSAVSGAGDINGDGIDDLIIGSPIADGDSIAAGQGNVVFGRSANDENTSATIGGRVWHDWNHNGLQDAFEPGIAGVEVEFIGTSDYTTFTDANGEYAFPLSSLTLQPSDYELFVHSYEIAFDADFTIPNVGNSSDIAPYGLQENDTYDSDMDDNPMSLSIESGQQLDIDLGIVSEIVSFYPDFNFDLSQSRIIEGDFVSVDLFVPNAVADNPLVIYEVDWGDGTTPEIFSYSLFQDSADIKHDYQQGGVYTVSITATDGEGDAVTQTQTILVDSIFPEFEIEAPFFQSENEPVRLNLLRQLPYFIRAEEEEIGITIDWDETIAITIDWGDGAVSSLDGSEAITPEHYYETSGDYEITVTATDEDGDTVTQRHFIQISAEFPEFDFHLPSLGQRNQEVSAYFSVLPGESDDGLQSESDVIYTLDWGNGEVQTFTSEDILAPHAYGEIFTPYTYQEDGYYTVTLTATDSDGDRTQQSQSILIGNTLPSDHGSEDGSTSSLLFRDHDRVFDGEPVRLRLDSRGAAPHHVTVNWGDGSAVESFYDVRNIPEHRYAQDGHYIVTVTATDKDGDRTTATSSVIVKPTFPDFRLDIFDRFSIENQPVYLEIDEQPVYWDINREELYESARYLSIDWGDGTILTHDYRAYGYWEHEYTNSGTYTITVTATDDDGDQSVRSQSVFINPSLPTFDLDDDVSINLGESYSPDIVTTNDEQTIYTVDWGDGTISEQSYYPPAHLYEDSGVYTLTVTATDEDGDRVVRSQSVFITAADGSEPNAPAFDFELSGSGYDDRTLSTLKDDVVNLDIYSTSNSNTTHIVDWGDGTGKKRLDYYTQDDSHVYTQDGQYQITVTAIDENGQTHTQTQTIAILSEPPAPFFRFSWLRQAYEEHFEPWRYPFFPEQREYKIAIESGEDAIYTIDWGDGTAPQVTQISDDNILPPAHAYARAGQYQVTVTATNDEGEISTQRQTINVISIDPRFVLHSRPSGENESVRLQLESLDHYRYDANLNVIYTVDWGDGSAIQSFSADELDTYGYGEIHKDNAYTNDGLYQITVTATDDDGDTYTQSYTHVVEAIAPEVTLSVPSTVTTGETFQPDIQQSGRDEAIAYSLNWGDGSEPTFSPSGSTIPEHRYTDAGIYTVQLTALDDDGDIVTQTQEIMVEAIAPTFDLDLPATELETTPVLLGLTPTFDASTPGSEADATITIDWGDGNTSILDGFDQSVPEHIYETGGHYTIVVTATDDDGESFRQEQFIYIISEFPDVDFALPNLGQVNQLITPDVTALHNEQGVTYTIDWGNGDTQTFADGELPQPYTYTEDGYYTVTLIAMDIDGDTVQQSQSILIGKTFPTPENTDTTSLPSFSTYLFDSSTEDESYTPYITYDGEEETVTFTIDWGDGTDSSFDYGSESVSSHVYTNDGFYTVMITATDDDGDQAVRSQVVEVSAKIPSFSTYLFDSSTEDESYTPYITYDGEEETVTFTIDWGDGTDSSFDYGSESVPSHVYTNDGFYTVMITATDDDGDEVVQSQVVEVSAKIPSFSTYLFDSSTEDESYTPYITYDGEEETATFIIDWGDGSDSSFVYGSESVPSHVYANDGSYTVIITATDDDGDEVVRSQVVEVSARIPSFSTSSFEFSTEDESYTPYITYDGEEETATFIIDWGDGSDSSFVYGSESVPSHVYANDGFYTVIITATDDDGDEVVRSQVVEVSARIPSFSTSSFEFSTEDESYTPYITYDGEEETATFIIDWGDGSDSSFVYGSESVPSHVYANDGFYTVIITATDDDGDEVVRSQLVEVQAVDAPESESPVFNFSLSDGASSAYPGYYASEDSPIDLSINGSTYEPMVSYTIDWGDGSAIETVFNDGLFDDSHIYTNDGQYQIIITATDDDGDSYTQVETITIERREPYFSFSLSDGASSAYPGYYASEDSPIDLSINGSTYEPMVSYTIDWGDGSAIETVFNDGLFDDSHIYTNDGQYQIIITAADDDGDVYTQVESITVETVVPEIALTLPATAIASKNIQPNIQHIGGDEAIAYTLDWGDGSEPAFLEPGMTVPNHSYIQAGTYTVTLTALDDDGDIVTVNQTITTNNAPPVIENQSFAIAIDNSPDQDLFTLEPTTGNLSVKSPPDFEAPVDGDRDQIDVQVSDDVNPISQTLDITVINVEESQSQPDNITVAKAGTSPSHMNGTKQADRLAGTDAKDVMSGGGGGDHLKGGAGDDTLMGDGGKDKLFGGVGNDHIEGGNGKDLLKGQAGDDILLGGRGADRLFGNSGDDLLDGGKGRDRYVGGNGADTFVLRLGEGVDTIRDFRLSQGDTIALADGLRFRDLTIKPLGNHGAKLFAEDKLLATVQSNRFDAINTNEAFSSL